jgi:hypothetical protein
MNMFRQRSIPEIILQIVSLKTEQLRKTGYAKVMPYVGQGLLKDTIQALKNWMDTPMSIADVCKKTIADDRTFHKKLNKPFQLPTGYQEMLEEIVSMIAWLCRPVGGFAREKDRREIQQLIAALEQKV